jgi:hypothetical protein
MIKQFYIDESFICDVSIHLEWGMFDCIDQNQLTPDQLLTMLKGEDRCSSYHNKDHTEFTKLRNLLEQDGYIVTQRNYWNGDRVIKSFRLNEWKFNKGHRFPSAAAMQNSIKCAKKYGWPNISGL